MLEHYFQPRTVDRIRASWIGPAIERHFDRLIECGSSWRTAYRCVPILLAFGEFARSRGASKWEDLPKHVEAFVAYRVDKGGASRKGRALGYIRSKANAPVCQMLRLILPAQDEGRGRDGVSASWPLQDQAPGYLDYLTRERGLSPYTIFGFRYHLVRFEAFLRERGVADLGKLSVPILNAFMMEGAKTLSISLLQGRCGALRALLRYLHRQGICPQDLGPHVERPRTYRLSGLPRSITQEDVGRLLSVVDRRTKVGKRDYAILLLLVTYGLRAREVAALTLDDLDWQRDRLRVPNRKAAHSTVYPLSTAFGEALVEYIRGARPAFSGREVFLTVRPPFRPLRYHVVSHVAGVRLRRAGVSVPRAGSHTLRHTCVQRLVDADFSFKEIGDYVGHRSEDSTRVYGKIAIEALREVALGDGEEVL